MLSEKEFELLFKENFQRLCFLRLKYVKDMDTAKEIVQESFTALWEKKEQIDTENMYKVDQNLTEAKSKYLERCIRVS